MDIKLNSVMYDYVRSLPPKVIDHISPSLLGGCMRRHYYEIKHIPHTTPPSPGALVNFQMGFLYEQLMEKALEDSGLDYKSQWHLEDEELNLSGTLDFALHDLETDEWEVVDTKTESILAAGYRKREKTTFLEGHDNYVIQLGTYIMMLRRKGFNCSRGRFVTITKDNGMIEEHHLSYTPELEERIMARINKLNQHLKDGTVPDCECSGWEINYCAYGDVDSIKPNSKGKLVPTKCCSLELLIETIQWR